MFDTTKYIEEIDLNRARRAKELSELKVRMGELNDISRYSVHSKALIVLSYAHWEGFYNECANSFLSALREKNRKVIDVSWPMLIGVIRPELQRLRDRNHSIDAESQFVDKLKDLLHNHFDEYDTSVILSRSNLDFKKLSQNFKVLGFDLKPYQRWRLQIDKELVGWRHSVAHGDDPDLSSLDLKNHIQFTQDLLLLLADTFQHGLLAHCLDDSKKLEA